MRIIQLVPAKGAFTPGEIIRLVAEVAGEVLEPTVIQLSIYHLAQEIDTIKIVLTPENRATNITFEWQAPLAAPCGYGVIAKLIDRSGQAIDSISSAFDVLTDWTTFPRYGFLTDFSPNRTDLQETVAALAQFHINGLQFYDWQYRHDQLLPPQPEYIDPLGRSLSLDTIRKFIDTAHKYGIAAMPYLAVYAASIEFWRAHLGWALYDANDQPITFESFLGLMDPSPDSPWSNHLLGQCREVLRGLPFDGLHVDQYGDPKTGFNANGDLVDLPNAFVDFIQKLKVSHPRAAVVFNAVGNWPIEELVTAPQDFVYIEIWPPDVYFRDVWRIVANARASSGGKPVVIALYLSASHPENVRLADALIFSLGGSRIELGEHVRLLADPYFPKHQALSPDLTNILRRYYDFLVRYGEFLGPTADLLENDGVKAPPHVWVSIRSCPGWLVLSVINLSGLVDPRWDEEQSSPTPLTDIFLQGIVSQTIRQVWWASPDLPDISLFPLHWTKNHLTVSITLPELDHWAIIAFELETSE